MARCHARRGTPGAGPRGQGIPSAFALRGTRGRARQSRQAGAGSGVQAPVRSRAASLHPWGARQPQTELASHTATSPEPCAFRHAPHTPPRRPRRAAQTTHPATRGDSHGGKSRIFDHTVHGGPRLVLFRGGASFTFGHALAKCSCDSNGRSANGWSVRPPPGQPVRCEFGPAVNRLVSPSGPICARRPWDQWCGKGESLACWKTTWGW